MTSSSQRIGSFLLKHDCNRKQCVTFQSHDGLQSFLPLHRRPSRNCHGRPISGWLVCAQAPLNAKTSGAHEKQSHHEAQEKEQSIPEFSWALCTELYPQRGAPTKQIANRPQNLILMLIAQFLYARTLSPMRAPNTESTEQPQTNSPPVVDPKLTIATKVPTQSLLCSATGLYHTIYSACSHDHRNESYILFLSMQQSRHWVLYAVTAAAAAAKNKNK